MSAGDCLSLGALEDLRSLRADPDHHVGGQTVGDTALARICGVATSRSWNDEPDSDRRALIEHGWYAEDGSLTEAGRRLVRDLRTDADTLRLCSADVRGRRRGWIRAGQHTALVVIEDALQRWEDDEFLPYGASTFTTMPVSALPIFLAKWGGLSPAWSLGVAAELDDPDAVTRRIRDDGEPVPAGADDDLARMWAAPWTSWTVRTEGSGAQIAYISAGDSGQFVLRTNRSGRTVLAPRPGNLLWGDLQKLVSDLASQQEPIDPDESSDW